MDNSKVGLQNILSGPNLMAGCHRSPIPQRDTCRIDERVSIDESVFNKENETNSAANISTMMKTTTSLINEEFHLMMKEREIYIHDDIYREIIKTFAVK